MSIWLEAGHRDLVRIVALAGGVDPHLGDEVRAARRIVGRRIERRALGIGHHERVGVGAHARGDGVQHVGVVVDVDVVVHHHDEFQERIGDERRHRGELGLALLHLLDRDIADEAEAARRAAR